MSKRIFSNPSVSLSKGSSTSNQAFLLRRKDVNRPTRCSEPLRYKVGGASKPSPWLCGMGPPGCYGDQLAIILLKVSAWRGLQVKPTRIVPHCSIALHLSPLE